MHNNIIKNRFPAWTFVLLVIVSLSVLFLQNPLSQTSNHLTNKNNQPLLPATPLNEGITNENDAHENFMELTPTDAPKTPETFQQKNKILQPTWEKTSLFSSFDGQIANKYLKHDIENAKEYLQKARHARYIVQFNSFQSADFAKTLLKKTSTDVEIKDFKSLPFLMVSTSNSVVLDSLKYISGVKRIFIDSYAQIIDPQEWKSQLTEINRNKPNFNNTLWFGSEGYVGTTRLHSLGVNGSGIKVAVIDTGIDKSHPDLDDFDNNDTTTDPKIIAEASFVDYNDDGIPEEDPTDYFGHGTHVAGTIAGNGYQIGMAPSAWLLNAKALDSGGGAYVSWVLKAIDWAIQNNADVISMSIGWPPTDVEPLLNAAVEYAWSQGIVVVIAAGNAGYFDDSVSSPGMAKNVITVGAVSSYDKVATFSSGGISPLGAIDPDISAPGVDIISTLPGESYGAFSGTSMATPHVSGAAALLLQAFKNENPSPDKIKQALLSSVDDLKEPIFRQGIGRLNVSRAYDLWSTLPAALLVPSNTEMPLELFASPNETLSFRPYVIASQAGTFNLQVLGNGSSLATLSTTQLTGPGQLYFNVSVNVPSNALVGETYSIAIKLVETNDILNITLHITSAQNDANSGTDAGETLDTAVVVSLNNNVTGTLANNGDSRDFYRLSLNENDNVSLILKMTNFESDYDLVLMDENGTWLFYSAAWFNLDEKISFSAPYTGTYYIMVWKYAGTGTYTLSITTLPTGTSLALLTADAKIIGNYASNTVDKDNDGKIDSLVISFDIAVYKDGFYDIIGSLAQNRDNWELGKYSFTYDWVTLYLTAGTHRLNVSFNGEEIYRQMFNGSFLLDYLFIGDPLTYTILDLQVKTYTTPSYTYDQFEVPDVYIDLEHAMVSSLDQDNNGKIEEVLYTFTLKFTQPQSYETLYINMPYVMTNENFSSLTFIGAYYTLQNVVGPTDIVLQFSIYFDGLLEDKNFNGTFIIPVLSVFMEQDMYSFDSFFIISWLTNNMNQRSDIEPLFETIIVDYLNDADKNGNNDTLAITVEITPHKDGFYYIDFYSSWLFSITDQRATVLRPQIEGASNYGGVYLNAGETANITARYVGSDLSAHRINGPYYVNALSFMYYIETQEADQSYGNTIFHPFKRYITNPYSWKDFEPSPLEYLFQWNDKPIDTDNNGKIDAIEVTLTFNVTKTGEYALETIFVDYESRGWQFFDRTITNVSFDATGIQNVTLILDGMQLALSKYHGRLDLINLGIINGTYSPPPDYYFYDDEQPQYLAIYYAAALSHIYNGTEFIDALPFYFTGNYFFEPIDSDNDGKYESLDVIVEYHLKKPQFEIYIDMSLSPLATIVGIPMLNPDFPLAGIYDYQVIYPSSETGDKNLTWSIEAKQIWLTMLSNKWLFHVDAFGYSNNYDFSAPFGEIFATIDYLSRDQFDFTPAVRVLDISQLDGVDKNSDGTWDYLNFNLNINVTQAGSYIFYFGVIYELDIQNYLILSMLGFKATAELQVGITNITARFGAYSFAIDPFFGEKIELNSSDTKIYANLLFVYIVERSPDLENDIDLFFGTDPSLSSPVGSSLANIPLQGLMNYDYTSPLQFSRTPTDELEFSYAKVDLNNDLAYDQVEFYINVSISRNIKFAAVLYIYTYSAQNNGYAEYMLKETFDLPQGNHTITLMLDGQKVVHDKIDGLLYLGAVILADFDGFTVTDYYTWDYFSQTNTIDIDYVLFIPTPSSSDTSITNSQTETKPGKNPISGFTLVPLSLSLFSVAIMIFFRKNQKKRK